MRSRHAVGTVFRIDVQLIEKEGEVPYLFCPHTAGYEVIERNRKA